MTSQFKRSGSKHFLGHDIDELPVQRELWEAMIHPEDLAYFRAHRSYDTTRGHNVVIEYRVRHRDGYYVRVRGMGITLTDGDGKPTRRISFMQQVGDLGETGDTIPARAFHGFQD